MIGRREFITLLGGAAAAWPVAARAQQTAGVPVVGYLYDGAAEPTTHFVAAFRKGLSEAGLVEGRDVAIEYRFADNDTKRLAEMAAELVRRRVAVIAAPGSLPAALAAKAATTTIPIVFMIAGDPVQLGLVASLNRPGSNLTGLSNLSTGVIGKRLGLLHELVPKATRFAALINVSPNAEFTAAELKAAASASGLQIEIFKASTYREIDLAFTNLIRAQAEALLVGPGGLLINRRIQIVTQAAHQRLPAIYGDRIYAESGGLATYGSSVADQVRQVGIFAGRILKGEKPAEMPVMQASKFEFIINLQTARTQGITVPPTLLASADEVIE